MLDKNTIEKELQFLLLDLDSYYGDFKTNKENDLNVFKNFESKIREICNSIVLLNPEEQKYFTTSIKNLLQKFENLRSLLITKKKQIEEQINSLNLSYKASKAYKKHQIK